MYPHQQPHQQVAQQHLALRHQQDSAQPVALVHQHQVALAEAALEAHLQHQRSVDRQVGSVAAWEATKWEAQAQQT